MRGHLGVRQHGRMDPGPARYTIRVNGHLGATLLSAFPALASQQRGAHTVLTGPLDQSALFGVLAEIGAVGLELIEVRQLSPERELPALALHRGHVVVLTGRPGCGKAALHAYVQVLHDQLAGTGVHATSVTIIKEIGGSDPRY
jgi:hypothetical protein